MITFVRVIVVAGRYYIRPVTLPYNSKENLEISQTIQV